MSNAGRAEWSDCAIVTIAKIDKVTLLLLMWLLRLVQPDSDQDPPEPLQALTYKSKPAI